MRSSTYRKPKRLVEGDTIAVVSPSWGGPATFPWRYEAGRRQLIETLGLKVEEMPHTLADADWLAKNPAARAADIMEAFSNPRYAAVIASIGGDDAVRLIPHLDLETIRRNPKIFLGYSDTTAIHFACLKAGLGSFYGPSVMAGFAENGGVFDYATASLRRTLFQPAPIGQVEPNAEGWTVERLEWADPKNQERRRRLNVSTGYRLLRGRGFVRGHLMGGCAEVLEMLKGSPWWPSLDAWQGAILFYETSEEAPAPAVVTRWLRNFAAQGILQHLAGIVLGRPGGDVSIEDHADYDKAVLRALDEAGLHDMPVLANLDFGHTDPICTLPYGAAAEIDCEAVSFSILESAVV